MKRLSLGFKLILALGQLNPQISRFGNREKRAPLIVLMDYQAAFLEPFEYGVNLGLFRA